MKADMNDILRIGRPKMTLKKSSSKHKKKPSNLSREAWSLVQDSRQETIDNLVKATQKPRNKVNRSKSSRIRSWIHRTNGVFGKRWRREDDKRPSESSKTSLAVHEFTSQEYWKKIGDDEFWSLGRTRYLFDLLKRCNYRFVIAYGAWDEEGHGKIDVEGIKERFYYVLGRLNKTKRNEGFKYSADDERKRRAISELKMDRNEDEEKEAEVVHEWHKQYVDEHKICVQKSEEITYHLKVVEERMKEMREKKTESVVEKVIDKYPANV
ncbi:hypothetical protein ACOME3_008457 [Neoechinorhynchus agilis]